MALKWTGGLEEQGSKHSSESKIFCKSQEPLNASEKDLSQPDSQVPSDLGKYPLLESVLAVLKRQKQPMYTYKDAEVITGQSVRALQKRAKQGVLTVRKLGKFRFLNQDLEQYFENSAKKSE